DRASTTLGIRSPDSRTVNGFKGITYNGSFTPKNDGRTAGREARFNFARGCSGTDTGPGAIIVPKTPPSSRRFMASNWSWRGRAAPGGTAGWFDGIRNPTSTRRSSDGATQNPFDAQSS